MEFTDLEVDGLDATGVLVIAGRSERVPFSKVEMAAISTFCHSGGSLLLMANHKHLVAPQNQVAEVLALPIEFHEKTFLQEKQRLTLCASHPISRDCGSGLQIRTSCSMTLKACSSATVLAKNEDPDIGDFAVALEDEGGRRWRTVVMTSAGHLSSCDDSGTDLWAAASNATWMLNTVEWLAYGVAE